MRRWSMSAWMALGLGKGRRLRIGDGDAAGRFLRVLDGSETGWP